MRVAAFDFGSNSIKCLIVDLQNGISTELANLRAQNRLASYLDNSSLQAEAVTITLNLLAPLINKCRDLQVEKYLAVGTQALRVAKNSDDFINAVHQATGLQVRVLSGTEEACLAWKGVISGITGSANDVCVFDSGGASTEFIWGTGEKIKDLYSFPVGAVSLTKEYIHCDPPSPDEYDKMQDYIFHSLQHPLPDITNLIGIGGGVLACTKVALGYDTDDLCALDGFIMQRSELERQIELYRTYNLEQRKLILGMEQGRADIILAAAMLYHAILESTNLESFQVSTRGLRHGLVSQYLSNA